MPEVLSRARLFLFRRLGSADDAAATRQPLTNLYDDMMSFVPGLLERFGECSYVFLGNDMRFHMVVANYTGRQSADSVSVHGSLTWRHLPIDRMRPDYKRGDRGLEGFRKLAIPFGGGAFEKEYFVFGEYMTGPLFLETSTLQQKEALGTTAPS